MYAHSESSPETCAKTSLTSCYILIISVFNKMAATKEVKKVRYSGAYVVVRNLSSNFGSWTSSSLNETFGFYVRQVSLEYSDRAHRSKFPTLLSNHSVYCSL